MKYKMLLDSVTDSVNAPRSDQYQFKYNQATRPTATPLGTFSNRRAKENIQIEDLILILSVD